MSRFELAYLSTFKALNQIWNVIGLLLVIVLVIEWGTYLFEYLEIVLGGRRPGGAGVFALTFMLVFTVVAAGVWGIVKYFLVFFRGAITPANAVQPTNTPKEDPE